MNYSFLMRSFFVGIAAASGVGPIFVLTFNKGASHGFARGFASALGAAVADGFFYFLALVGILATIEDSWQFMLALDFVGGVILLFLGIRMIKNSTEIKVAIGEKEQVVIAFGRSLMLTLINPMSVLFFMVVVAKILPEGVLTMSYATLVLNSGMVTCGTTLVLGGVALVASFVGHGIRKETLKLISFITSTVFIVIGAYLLWRLAYLLYYG